MIKIGYVFIRSRLYDMYRTMYVIVIHTRYLNKQVYLIK